MRGLLALALALAAWRYLGKDDVLRCRLCRCDGPGTRCLVDDAHRPVHDLLGREVAGANRDVHLVGVLEVERLGDFGEGRRHLGTRKRDAVLTRLTHDVVASTLKIVVARDLGEVRPDLGASARGVDNGQPVA